MRTTLLTFLIFGLPLASFAADEVVTSTETANKAEVQKAPAQAAPSEVAESTGTAPVEVKKSISTVESKPAADKAASEAKTETFVNGLQTLVDYHEKQIASIKHTMAQWAPRVTADLQKQTGLQADVKAKTERMDQLLKENTKAGKREAARLKKEIAQSNKQIALMKKELVSLNKDLVVELKQMSKESQQSLKDAYQTTGQIVSQSQQN